VTIYYLSPALPLEGAAEGVLVGSLIVFGVLFLVSLVAGRAFCGWVCPSAGLHDATVLNQCRPAPRGHWVKYLIWFPWLILLVALVVRFHGFHQVDPLYQTAGGISVAGPESYVVYYFFLALIVVLAFTAGRRSFCHHVCWIAPFMVLGRRIRNLVGWPALQLAADAEFCSACGRCSRECPMSLDVMGMVRGGGMEKGECILCGQCADTCPKQAVRLEWGAVRGTAPGLSASGRPVQPPERG
jgi:polyferredoxin